MVPLERGAFGPPVLDQVVDVGFAAARLEQEVVALRPGGEPARDVAEEGGGLAGGEAAGLAVELGPGVGAVEVDRELPRLLRQLVVEGDPGPLAGAATDRRAGEAAAEGPELRLAAGEDLLLGLADPDPDVVVAQDRGDRQPGAEGRRRQRRRRLRRQRQQAAAPAPEGQERGQRASAEGAEQGSAPEAGRA
ncbi:MAG TPA: hypothetical protein VFU16_01655 [Solirubrobacterales bacterium]|nr:hypothetical protein [Solirubrobacterales bacterium]